MRGRREVEEVHAEADQGAGTAVVARALVFGHEHESVAKQERVAGNHVEGVHSVPEKTVFTKYCSTFAEILSRFCLSLDYYIFIFITRL